MNVNERSTIMAAKPFIYAQGDILLVVIDKAPNALKKQQRVTVAEGEITGHHHVLEATEGASVLTDTDAEFVRIMGASGLLTHPEHDTITLPPGDYQVIRQREYAYGEERQVQD